VADRPTRRRSRTLTPSMRTAGVGVAVLRYCTTRRLLGPCRWCFEGQFVPVDTENEPAPTTSGSTPRHLDEPRDRCRERLHSLDCRQTHRVGPGVANQRCRHGLPAEPSGVEVNSPPDAMKGAGPPLLVTLWRMLEVGPGQWRRVGTGMVEGRGCGWPNRRAGRAIGR
jgi:hypothetical protein